MSLNPAALQALEDHAAAEIERRGLNQPMHENVVVALYDLLDACEDFLDRHGDGCRCATCTGSLLVRDARALHTFADIMRGVFESELLPSRRVGERQRLREERASARDAAER